MTTFDPVDQPRRFERELREALRDEAGPGHPDYLPDVLVRTVVARQRPAWTFTQRWFPVSVRVAPVPLSGRPDPAVLALLVLLLGVIIGGLALVGSQPQVPSPFGPAANGLVAFHDNGDVFTVEPDTGATQLVVTGPAIDSHPIWSRDGTALAFQRREGDQSRLMAVAPDGSGLITLTPEPMAGVHGYSFSPDGREIGFVASQEGPGKLGIATTDGSGVRMIDVGMDVHELAWLPPDGREILYSGTPSEEAGYGLWAVDPRSGAVRTILAPEPGVGRGLLSVSPDGSRIAYAAEDLTDTSRNTYAVHVVSTDGTGEIVLPMPKDATFQDAPAWSNDGRRLVIIRGYASRNQDMAVAIVPADGSGLGIESARGLTGCCDNAFEWSPSDSAILFLPDGNAGDRREHILIDPATGATNPAPWTASSLPAWQRLVP
jgi:Tol biopolymer transport system component